MKSLTTFNATSIKCYLEDDIQNDVEILQAQCSDQGGPERDFADVES